MMTTESSKLTVELQAFCFRCIPEFVRARLCVCCQRNSLFPIRLFIGVLSFAFVSAHLLVVCLCVCVFEREDDH